MNKIFLSLVCIYSIVTSLSLNAAAVNSLELRSAAFFHQSQKFRKVYDRVNADFQIEGTWSLTRSFELWTEIDYMSTSKKKEDYHTKIHLTNCSGGIQYVHSFCPKLDGYLGVGLSVLRVDLHNRSCCSKEEECKLVWGGITKAGVRYWFVEDFFLDVFADYLYQSSHFEKHVNLGGVKIGAGIGKSF